MVPSILPRRSCLIIMSTKRRQRCKSNEADIDVVAVPGYRKSEESPCLSFADDGLSSSFSRASSSILTAQTESTRSASSTESFINSSSLSESIQSFNKSVKFGNISIREFDVTVGDNPACSSGVPISLNWTYNPVHEEFPVEVFENYRDGQRCSPDELKLSERVRYQMLVDDWKVSKAKIARAERKCRQTKNERQESLERFFADECRDDNSDAQVFFTGESAVNTNKFPPFFRMENLKAKFVKMLKRC